MSIVFDAPWIPSHDNVIKKMLTMAELQPGETLYDLGSGDGRILLHAATKFKAKAVGIELNPLLVTLTNLRIFFRGLQNRVQVRWGDFFSRDISEADVVTMYLLQKTNDRLIEKLKAELQPGSRIISYIFNLPGFKPQKVDGEWKIYLYRI